MTSLVSAGAADAMQLPDVNVLIYAHREDAAEHDRYAAWLLALTAADEPFALSEVVLAGFLRIVTNPKIFDPPAQTECWPPARAPAISRLSRSRHFHPARFS